MVKPNLTCIVLIGGESSFFSMVIVTSQFSQCTLLCTLRIYWIFTVNSAINAIKQMHEIRSYIDPTENSFVKSLLRILQHVNWEAGGKKKSHRQWENSFVKSLRRILQHVNWEAGGKKKSHRQ